MTEVTRVVTYRGLRAIADGVRLGRTDTRGILHVTDSGSIENVYHFQDSASDPLIVVIGVDRELDIPLVMRQYRQALLDRMVSFVSRAAVLPIVLPHRWHAFQRNNMSTFFCVARGIEESAPRWVAEVRPNGSEDVVFWESTEPGQMVLLESFAPDMRIYERAVAAWRQDYAASAQELQQHEHVRKPAGLDIQLDGSGDGAPIDSVGMHRTFSEWLPALTDHQRAFVEANPNRSMRLRGAAGTGKTLTMSLKAMREALEARNSGRSARILYVTHSWALAGEVEELIRSLSEVGHLPEIEVAPLVFVAQSVLPTERQATDQSLIGEDSLSGKRLQLVEIEAVLDQFVEGDWGGVRDYVTPAFKERIESVDDEVRGQLVQDLLLEFGCVLGADGILPTINGEARYLRLMRAPWMMPLENDADKRVVYALYESYLDRLDDEGRMTIDQLLNDFLNFLETNAWHKRRRSEGYDYIFVDEYHLFNIQERQLIRYLGMHVDALPRIFMALDPRQSPYAHYQGDGTTGDGAVDTPDLEPAVVELPTVHRASPEILELLKAVHLDFPNLGLDEDWGMNVGEIESSARSGPVPSVVRAGTASAERTELYNALVDSYPRIGHGGQVAVAVVNEARFDDVRSFVQSMPTQRYRVTAIEGRDDAESLRTRKRGIVVGLAEHLAGLQFETVFVTGVPELEDGLANAGYRRRRFLSLLYLALSRASRDLKIFVNDETGMPPVLSRAGQSGAVTVVRGAEV